MDTLWRAYNYVKVGVAIILQLIGGCPIAFSAAPHNPDIVIVSKDNKSKPSDRIMDAAAGYLRLQGERAYLGFVRMIEDWQELLRQALCCPTFSYYIEDDPQLVTNLDTPPPVVSVVACGYNGKVTPRP